MDYLWLGLLITSLLLIIVDLFLTGHMILPVGVAGIVVALAVLIVPMQLWVALLAWSAASGVSWYFFAKYFSKKRPGEMLFGAPGMVGKEALVVEAIDSKKNTGQVKLYGDTWAAFSDDADFIPTGEKVEIIEIVGNKVKVFSPASLGEKMED